MTSPARPDAPAAGDELFGDVRLKDHVDATTEDIVWMKNVHKTYLLGVEGVPALRGVSLSVKRGEFVVIFGTSGGGKTTMLNLIGTIDKPTKGEMSLCGHRITEKTNDSLLAEIRLKKMGFVFQTFNLLASLTAQENVEMPMILAADLTSAQRAQRAKELLSTVGLGKRLDHYPSQLSGGEQQRVTIARAIANRPDLLLLDEPTGDLDSVNGAIVMDLLTKLHDRGLTLVMVTHDVHLKSFADRVVWMRDGRIQRIDVNSEAEKASARAQLAEELKLARAKAQRSTETRIELRQPAQYETSPLHDAATTSVEIKLSLDGVTAPVIVSSGAAVAHNATTTTTRSATNGDDDSTTAKKKKKKSKAAKDVAITVDNDDDDDDDVAN